MATGTKLHTDSNAAPTRPGTLTATPTAPDPTPYPTPTHTPNPAPPPHTQWRLELFYKTRTELQQLAAFLAANNIRRINLTNKHANDNLTADIALLKSHIPGLDACAHYSIKYNYSRGGPAACTDRLAAFLAAIHSELPGSSHVLLVSGGGKRRTFDAVAALDALQQHAPPASDDCLSPAATHASEHVQGPCPDHPTAAGDCPASHARSTSRKPHASQQPTPPNPTPQLSPPSNAAAASTTISTTPTSNTIAALLATTAPANATTATPSVSHPAFEDPQPLPAISTTTNTTGSHPVLGAPHPLRDLAVAFNPYHPDPAARKQEAARLSAKLATGLVTRIYLQMGTDLTLLRQGLQYLRLLADAQAALERRPPQLYGSLFLPSKRLLAQMRFRPWAGVYLSEEYLSGVGAAEAVTRALLLVYREWGVVPLVESRVRGEEELGYLQQLLGVQPEVAQYSGTG